MASAVGKQPAAARLAAVAAARCLPTATRGSQNSYTTSGDTTFMDDGGFKRWMTDRVFGLAYERVRAP